MKRRFKYLTNRGLINRINDRFQNGLNDDDEVYELFERKRQQGFRVIIGYDTYDIVERGK
tara:strand:- start:12721 stop:12900 length:180 start_codon:yes stop_codon:yes gene_type:complete